MPDQPSQAVQDYLKAIHSLGGAEGMVSPLYVAERLGVRAPSVTGMLKRLAEAGWIRYEPGCGARLTPRGVTEARRVIRRHRLVGHPIPTRDGSIAKRKLQPLSQFREGQRVVIREATDDDPERLRRWHSLGLTPGATVRILSYHPLDDLFQLQTASQTVPMGSEGLVGLLGELAPEG
jgi:DtxR family Mn-dependent transcriptional regulator